MAFQQQPPALGNQYHDDQVLKSYLKNVLPPDVLSAIEPELVEMGQLAGNELYQLQLADRLNAVSYTHLRAHETPEHLVCRLLLEKKKIELVRVSANSRMP